MSKNGMGVQAQLYEMQQITNVLENLKDYQDSIEWRFEELKTLIEKNKKKGKVYSREELMNGIKEKIGSIKREYKILQGLDSEHPLIEHYKQLIVEWENELDKIMEQNKSEETANSKSLGEMPAKEIILNVLFWRKGFRVLSCIVYLILLWLLSLIAQ